LPTPLVDTPYQQTSGDTYRADGGFVEMVERPGDSIDMLVGEWPSGVTPLLKMTSRVATLDRAVDLTRPTVPPPLDMRALERFLRPTKLIPIDGIVKGNRGDGDQGGSAGHRAGARDLRRLSITRFAIRKRSAAARRHSVHARIG
jgi:hypothetical protein